MVHNDTSWIEVQCGRLSVEAYWLDVGQQLGLKPKETARIRSDFYRSDKRNDELVAYIDQVRAAGLRTAVLSNFSVELRGFLKHHTLLDHFDRIAISAEIGVMKPSAKAYQVDDQPGNINAAEALGMQGIVFRDNPSCIAELTRLLATP
jgi:FMN phosphatase YigB (HAD superfamily)